jgi:phosphatidylglycerol:prolipoprotein diacylglycerol transferase
MLIIDYPHIDPIIFAIGPLAIRWYALAYIVGLVLGWRYGMALAKRPPGLVSAVVIDDFLAWATLGVVIGGRTGYVLFYGLTPDSPFRQNWLESFAVWHGGMSFHGGCLGVIIAMAFYCRRKNLPYWAFSDIIACVVPIGLFFGRIANFINGELYGRPTDVDWAMIFPSDPEHLPRHPSQLYQAGMEGLCLFVLLFILERAGLRRRPGLVTGAFLLGYAIARTIGELFRQPDAQLGFLIFGTTMGQLLSIPMVLGGLWLIIRARPVAAAA